MTIISNTSNLLSHVLNTSDSKSIRLHYVHKICRVAKILDEKVFIGKNFGEVSTTLLRNVFEIRKNLRG